MLNIFDVRTGKVMRDFKGSADEFAIGGGGVTGVTWPVFRYFCGLFVYKYSFFKPHPRKNLIVF